MHKQTAKWHMKNENAMQLIKASTLVLVVRQAHDTAFIIIGNIFSFK